MVDSRPINCLPGSTLALFNALVSLVKKGSDLMTHGFRDNDLLPFEKKVMIVHNLVTLAVERFHGTINGLIRWPTIDGVLFELL